MAPFLCCQGSFLKKIFYASTKHRIGQDDNRPLIKWCAETLNPNQLDKIN